MGPIEQIGLLKMDFLGLSNLTIINNALRIIKKVYNEVIDIETIRLDDSKTFELLQNGDTTGVFQFESQGMKRYIKKLKPTVFEDLVAMGALYRPGPLTAGYTDQFVERKNDPSKIVYPAEKMRQALESTYGVIVYQEQVMRISKEFCGFSEGEADTLRKAIGKKQPETLAKMKMAFIKGGTDTSGASQEFMEKFWEQLLGFAAYCFNKSHSACYGLISYQTAYLKANFFSAFMASLMTADSDDIERIGLEINECRTHSIDVLPPDINKSFVEFSVDIVSKNIFFGLGADSGDVAGL
jgi:DNA polymerase-3 subunit alpha